MAEELAAFLRRELARLDSGAAPIDKIRSGIQGTVTAGYDDDGNKIACKIIHYGDRMNPDKAIQDFHREYESLEACPHPSIVKYISFEHHANIKTAHIRMAWAGSELAETLGGAIDLGDVIEHRQGVEPDHPNFLPEPFIWHVLFHIGAALALCHHGIELHRTEVPVKIDSKTVLRELNREPNPRLLKIVKDHPSIDLTTELVSFHAKNIHEPIIHRDIKPRNILLSDPPAQTTDQPWRIKGNVSLGDRGLLNTYPMVLLGDFGLSAPLKFAQTRGIGTPGYSAPEIPLEPPRPMDTPFEWQTSCDIYSLGATIRHLMSLDYPQPIESGQDINLPSHYSQTLRSLVDICLHREASKRPTAIAILDTCIRHQPWHNTRLNPYGVPLAPNFFAVVRESWRGCTQSVSQKSVIEDFETKRTHDDWVVMKTIDVLSLDKKTESSALSMLIAVQSQYGGSSVMFLPYLTGESLVTRESILRELDLAESEADWLIKWTLTRAKKVFLSLIRWENLAPVFTRSQYDYHVPEKGILPFLKIDADVREGGFSWVHKVTIHPEHIDGNIKEVAMKEIRVNRNGDDSGIHKEWEREARLLASINQIDHPHIIPCLAAIRRHHGRYFMFPWATGDSLRAFWTATKEQSPDASLVRESLDQLVGISDALRRLHNFERTTLDQSANQLEDDFSGTGEHGQYSIRHGNLKPENLLRFIEPNNLLGTLKIGDMGLAEKHILQTSKRVYLTSARYGTIIQYQPPEAELVTSGGRSHLYDTWSMGCIIFEFVIWLLYGNAALNRFYRDLQGTFRNASPYYEPPAPGSGDGCTVHRAVQHWANHLQQNDPECGTDSAIGDLLKLVLDKLLVVDLPPFRGKTHRTNVSEPVVTVIQPPSTNLETRRLLWRQGVKQEQPSMKPTVFPLERRTAMPRWSWMAYAGPIDYLLEPSFDEEMEWESQDIIPTWFRQQGRPLQQQHG
ncbi:Cyclin-dependent kinase 2 [Apiospora arundinis]|uniref:Cyclin-dependent kinase 2 n=1 Tax=Apiospora arundinis TaxID=335852 RepID=A0ABR2IA61_9PEZI